MVHGCRCPALDRKLDISQWVSRPRLYLLSTTPCVKSADMTGCLSGVSWVLASCVTVSVRSQVQRKRRQRCGGVGAAGWSRVILEFLDLLCDCLWLALSEGVTAGVKEILSVWSFFCKGQWCSDAWSHRLGALWYSQSAHPNLIWIILTGIYAFGFFLEPTDGEENVGIAPVP